MTGHQYTPDQIVDAIVKALHDGEVTAVPGLIGLLALQDPQRAQDVYDTLQAGIALGRGDEVELVIRAREAPGASR